MNNDNDFKELISTHLGKSGDGTVVKPYQTPEKHDKSLLVPMPRSYGRQNADVTSTFVGYEAWHAYEMSFLRHWGMPVTGILKIVYSSDVPFMVESKSLKLYLNSFDLEKFDSVEVVERIITADLSEALQGEVRAKFHAADTIENKYLPSPFNPHQFFNVDNMVVDISTYKEDESLLTEDQWDAKPNGLVSISFHTANLRSNCEITNQKDTGNCYIYLRGKAVPTTVALTKYIISLRDSQHFHENVTEIVYDRLNKVFKPEQLFVGNLYNRRGGIDIHSIRADSPETLSKIIGEYDNARLLYQKTAQQ